MPSPRQFVDIFFSEAGPDAPLAMFIHGGYWRSLQPQMFSSLARGLNMHGVTVALAGYDLCPEVGIGEIVEQIERACLFLWDRFRKRILVFGHSAGGHLAAAMLATDWRTRGAPEDLVPSAMAISGLFDLAPMIATSMNADFKLDEAEARRAVAARLAAAGRARVRCGGRGCGVERIPAPEPHHRRSLGRCRRR